jgi:hypothetical protein
MSNCCVCDKTSENVFDGLCPQCEPIWTNELKNISKTASSNMSIKDLFILVTKTTKEKYDLKRGECS